MAAENRPKMLKKFSNAICDEYCKHPEQYYKKYGKDEDKANEKLWSERCEKCAVCKLLF